MYADGTVCDDEEEKPFIDNGLEGVLPDDLPDIVTVICRHKVGEYSPRTGMIRCLCPSCVIATEEGRDDESLQEPNRWEMHCDMGQAKKWKASVRVVLEGHKTMPVGKWLEGFGIAVASRRAPRQQRQFGPKRSKLKRMKERGELEEETYRRLMPMKGWKKGGEVHRGRPRGAASANSSSSSPTRSTAPSSGARVGTTRADTPRRVRAALVAA